MYCEPLSEWKLWITKGTCAIACAKVSSKYASLMPCTQLTTDHLRDAIHQRNGIHPLDFVLIALMHRIHTHMACTAIRLRCFALANGNLGGVGLAEVRALVFIGRARTQVVQVGY